MPHCGDVKYKTCFRQRTYRITGFVREHAIADPLIARQLNCKYCTPQTSCKVLYGYTMIFCAHKRALCLYFPGRCRHDYTRPAPTTLNSKQHLSFLVVLFLFSQRCHSHCCRRRPYIGQLLWVISSLTVCYL